MSELPDLRVGSRVVTSVLSVLGDMENDLTHSLGRAFSGEVRAWARAHGIAVSQPGRIRASVTEQYQASARGR